MNTGKLHVLGDGISYDLAVLCHGIHLDLLGVLEELADNHRMTFRHIGGKSQEALKLVAVVADVHRGAREHIRRAYKHRKSDLVNKFVDVIHRCQSAPFRLVDADSSEHG